VVAADERALDSGLALRLRGVADAVVKDAVSLLSLSVMSVNSQSMPPCV
jgi:hypothetical protein